MVGNKRNTFWEIRFLPWKFGWDKVLERPRSFSVHCSSLPLNWVFGWSLWSQNFILTTMVQRHQWVRLYQTWMHKGLSTYQHFTNTVHSRSRLKGKQVLFANVMNEHCNQLYTYPGMFRGQVLQNASLRRREAHQLSWNVLRSQYCGYRGPVQASLSWRGPFLARSPHL